MASHLHSKDGIESCTSLRKYTEDRFQVNDERFDKTDAANINKFEQIFAKNDEQDAYVRRFENDYRKFHKEYNDEIDQMAKASLLDLVNGVSD